LTLAAIAISTDSPAWLALYERINNSHDFLQASMDEEKHNSVRAAILANAESFVRAARALQDQDVEHVRYHLATLALEEIGKATLLGMQFITGMASEEPKINLEKQFDDHIKKLFWAIWGPSFGDQKLTREQINQHQGFAQRIHDKRIFSLYADPELNLMPADKMTREDAERLIALAEARLGLERAHQTSSIENAEELKWFLSASNDPEKRRQIFGSNSLDKLSELRDVKAWVRWLQETHAQHEAQMKALVQSELNRDVPGTDSAKSREPKWRIKFRVYSHSHSIRQKPLNIWNAATDWIKLSATENRKFSRSKKDEFICEILLGKSVPVSALWHFGWGIARTLVTALNIGTRGFFWWYVPRDTEGWYDEIWDFENNAGVRTTEGPRLELSWGNLALRDEDIRNAAFLFGYLTSVRGTPQERPLNHYIGGITFMSKIDFHWRCEANTFEEFWKCFQEALKVNGDWDGVTDIHSAAASALEPMLPASNGLSAHVDLGRQLDQATKDGATSPKITLTEVVGMKLYCDLYFLKQAAKALRVDEPATVAS
jgi:AbiV family abortive infection protein